jgi:hypothetical protein
MVDVAILLEGAEPGDPATAEQLLALLYDDLRRLAARLLAREKAGQTFDPTGLAHEAGNKHARHGGGGLETRRHCRGKEQTSLHTYEPL